MAIIRICLASLVILLPGLLACEPALLPPVLTSTPDTYTPTEQRHITNFTPRQADPTPTPTTQDLALAPPQTAEETMQRIHQAMRIDMYNNQTFADHLDFLVACNWMLATATKQQVSIHTEDLTTERTAIALHLIGEHAGEDWLDFCRVEHGAQGSWGKVGTGKWDTAIAKYGPTPTPSASQAQQAINFIYADIKAAAARHPRFADNPISHDDISGGCRRFLYGSGNPVWTGTKEEIATKKEMESRSWDAEELINEAVFRLARADGATNVPQAAVAAFKDFCRVHGGPDSEFKTTGSGNWDHAMEKR